ILFVAMFTFTAMNTGELELDLGFAKRTWPISMTLAGTFFIGTLFGMLCMTTFVFRLINERRNLRRSLRVSESELSSLRNLPLSDAD
ncbi:MAG: LapA family protein, partial [Gammaproteobacteria bacterium]|nr:LapA family protein [Gammaproteobacteria bacterium]